MAPLVVIGTITFLCALRLKDALVDYMARDFRRDAQLGRMVRNLVIIIIGVIWALHLLKHGR